MEGDGKGGNAWDRLWGGMDVWAKRLAALAALIAAAFAIPLALKKGMKELGDTSPKPASSAQTPAVKVPSREEELLRQATKSASTLASLYGLKDTKSPEWKAAYQEFKKLHNSDLLKIERGGAVEVEQAMTAVKRCLDSVGTGDEPPLWAFESNVRLLTEAVDRRLDKIASSKR